MRRLVALVAALSLGACDRAKPPSPAVSAVTAAVRPAPPDAESAGPVRCEEIARLNEWRYSPLLSRLADGRILIAGGRHSDFSDWIAEAEILDVQQRTVTAAAPMHQARSSLTGHDAVTLDDGRVLVVGGIPGRTLELYDPGANRWSAATPIDAVVGGELDRLPSGRVLITAGIDMAHHGVTSRASLVWDPKTGRLTRVADLPIGDVDLKTRRGADGRLLIPATKPDADGSAPSDYRIFDERAAAFVPYSGIAPGPGCERIEASESDVALLSGWRAGEPILCAGSSSIVRFDESQPALKTIAVFGREHRAGGSMLLDARHAVVLGGLAKENAGIEVCALP